VYDKNKTDANARFSKEDEILIDWYLNKQDNTQIDANMYKNYKKDTKIDINLSYNSSNGYITFKIDNNTTPPTKMGVVHIDTPLYLWYSKYNKEYDYSSGSSCITHYCFEYEYKDTTSTNYNDVGSGYFGGSEVNNTEENRTRYGVKIYR
jgi:hypothetical protein